MGERRTEAIFATTHWGVVLAARGASPEVPATEAREALESLCRTYWRPVFACIRARAEHRGEAEDLTQEFFHRLLDGGYLAQVDPAKGRFRSFLWVAIQHFLSNARDRARALKRGGKVHFLSLEQLAEEALLDLEPHTQETPERIFERRWALAFLAEVLQRLRTELLEEGGDALFEAVKPFLGGHRPESSYADLAPKLGLTEAALKMRVSRWRQRYAQLVRDEVAKTVRVPEEVAEELRHLLRAVST